MTTIQIRIDEKTKNSAKKIIENYGMNISTALKFYLSHIVRINRVPIIITENGLTTSEEKAINKASWEAERGINVVTYKNWEDAQKDLDRLKKLADDNKKAQKFHKNVSKTFKKNSTKS